ncbi:MAG: molybdopterin-binding protein [Candidatus Sumerlaeia bacterium]|nr:molybdopterin-binding protein [Candidatus Sumerlaeia bacterium]
MSIYHPDAIREERAHVDPPVVAILTVSNSLDEASDRPGALLRDYCAKLGATIGSQQIVPDDPDSLARRVADLCDSGAFGAVLVNGGDEVTAYNGVYEALCAVIVRPLPGYGEIFRLLAWHDIGAAATLSCAVAGIRGRTAIFSMPGTNAGVRLAMGKLIAPELSHLAAALREVR